MSETEIPRDAIMTVLYQATQQPETVALFTSSELDEGDGYELQNVTDITDHLHELEDREPPTDAFVRGFLTGVAWDRTYMINGQTDLKNIARKFARAEKDLDELAIPARGLFDREDLTP